jgi:chaperone protein EcpD
MVCARALFCLAVGATLAAGDADASVVIGATRIVFPGASRDTAVRIENKGQEPALVQAWIDNGDDRSTPENAQAPFAITPPVFRIDPGRGHALRIVHVGEQPPTDKENLYWLNVLEIPPSPEAGKAANTLQFAFRHRLKLLHRPSGLSVASAEAPALLAWSVDHRGGAPMLSVSNPSPYVMSFNEVGIAAEGSAGKTLSLGGGMVAAHGQTTWPLPEGTSLLPGAAVTFATINDYGAVVPGTAKTVVAKAAADRGE